LPLDAVASAVDDVDGDVDGASLFLAQPTTSERDRIKVSANVNDFLFMFTPPRLREL